MSPNATTSPLRPRARSHTRASAAALVTPAALISTRRRDRPGRGARSPTASVTAPGAPRVGASWRTRTFSAADRDPQRARRAPRAPVALRRRPVRARSRHDSTRTPTPGRAARDRRETASASLGPIPRPARDRTLGDVLDHRTVGHDREAVAADCSTDLLIQRSGRPVTKTTGTPRRRHGAQHPGRVGATPCRRVRTRVPSRSVATSRRERGARAHARGSGRAMTRGPSSLLPRSSVKPDLASTRTLAPVVGSTAARTRTPAGRSRPAAPGAPRSRTPTRAPARPARSRPRPRARQPPAPAGRRAESSPAPPLVRRRPARPPRVPRRGPEAPRVAVVARG